MSDMIKFDGLYEESLPFENGLYEVVCANVNSGESPKGVFVAVEMIIESDGPFEGRKITDIFMGDNSYARERMAGLSQSVDLPVGQNSTFNKNDLIGQRFVIRLRVKEDREGVMRTNVTKYYPAKK